jgi:hypothetical protein
MKKYENKYTNLTQKNSSYKIAFKWKLRGMKTLGYNNNLKSYNIKERWMKKWLKI